MADRLFTDTSLAALYDLFCAGRPDFDFYLPLAMRAQSVLDVGCGTGALLHLVREAGHTGRLCGLDPAPGMLEQARRRADIEWVEGDLSSVKWKREFDLVLMTGHAFQVLVEDDDVRESLSAIRTALCGGGRFAFETRNPLARAWESWTPAAASEVTDGGGARIRLVREVELPIAADRVSFSHTFSSPDWDAPQVSRSTLRFMSIETLGRFLSAGAFVVEEQFGDWDRQRFTPISPEIITIARPA